MKQRTLLPKLGLTALAFAAGVSSVTQPVLGQTSRCSLPTEHAGMTFPVGHVDTGWTCRLHPIVTRYTTANKIRPVRSPIPETMYRYLLNHPSMAAALINRLDLGLYQAETRGPDRYWGYDGEGTEGIVELVYHDRTSRIYYLEGSHDSPLLPHLTGKAVVFLRMNPVTEHNGSESMETTIVAYTRLDNRVLSGLVSLFRPLIGGTVTRKLLKGIEAVTRLGQVMRQHPERVLFEATDPPALPDDQVAFLRHTLPTLRIRPPGAGGFAP